MGAVLGVLGFMMSLLAIWFTTEALRRADDKSDLLIRPHVRDLKLRLAANKELLTELDNRLADIERQVKVAKANRQESAELMQQVDAVKYGLDKARSFKPTSVYNA